MQLLEGQDAAVEALLERIAADPRHRDLGPAAGGATEIDNAAARLQETVLVVDLRELVCSPRAIAFALCRVDVRIVQLALQPACR